MRTRLTERLGIERPVVLAGMGGFSSHRLVAAVCSRECHLAGQEVGAADALVAAGDLDRQFVTEAEGALRGSAVLAGVSS